MRNRGKNTNFNTFQISPQQQNTIISGQNQAALPFFLDFYGLTSLLAWASTFSSEALASVLAGSATTASTFCVCTGVLVGTASGTTGTGYSTTTLAGSASMGACFSSVALDDFPLDFFFYFLAGSTASTFASSLGVQTARAALTGSTGWAQTVWLPTGSLTTFLPYFSLSTPLEADLSCFSFAGALIGLPPEETLAVFLSYFTYYFGASGLALVVFVFGFSETAGFYYFLDYLASALTVLGGFQAFTFFYSLGFSTAFQTFFSLVDEGFSTFFYYFFGCSTFLAFLAGSSGFDYFLDEDSFFFVSLLGAYFAGLEADLASCFGLSFYLLFTYFCCLASFLGYSAGLALFLVSLEALGFSSTTFSALAYFSIFYDFFFPYFLLFFSQAAGVGTSDAGSSLTGQGVTTA